MAAVALLSVFYGFAPTSFLAGLFRAPLPNRLIHIHGAVFTLWIILFASQVSLVTTRNVALHRRIGVYGFALAVAMVVLGVLAASDQMARHIAAGTDGSAVDVRAFYATPLGAIFMFATFVGLGYRYRTNPMLHKRLMLFATLALLQAAFDRWSILLPVPVWGVSLICYIPLFLATMIYDRWSTGAVRKVTIYSAVFMLAIQEGSHQLGYTAGWQHFATWVAAHTPAFH